jgi:hypothetical protein
MQRERKICRDEWDGFWDNWAYIPFVAEEEIRMLRMSNVLVKTNGAQILSAFHS